MFLKSSLIKYPLVILLFKTKKQKKKICQTSPYDLIVNISIER